MFFIQIIQIRIILFRIIYMKLMILRNSGAASSLFTTLHIGRRITGTGF